MSGEVKAVYKPGSPTSGWDIFQWPEFAAFCKRAGIDITIPTRSIVITIPWDDAATVEQFFLARDMSEHGVPHEPQEAKS